jgi:hypothetical protein
MTGAHKYSEKTCHRVTFCSTNVRSNPGRCGGKLATNRPRYDTSFKNPAMSKSVYAHVVIGFLNIIQRPVGARGSVVS